MKRVRTHYSKAFKIKAVELSNERGSIKGVAEELNVNWETLKRWKKEHSSGKLKLTGNEKTISPEQEEIARLKRALYESNLERDILKKAVGIFSKSDR